MPSCGPRTATDRRAAAGSAPDETAALNEAPGCKSGTAFAEAIVVTPTKIAVNPAASLRNFMASSLFRSGCVGRGHGDATSRVPSGGDLGDKVSASDPHAQSLPPGFASNYAKSAPTSCRHRLMRKYSTCENVVGHAPGIQRRV